MNYIKQLEEIEQIFELSNDNKNPSDIVLICRNVLEKVIDLIFAYSNERKPINASLLELINNQKVQEFCGNDVMVDSLHFIRIVGINALHEKHIKRTQAKVAISNTEKLIELVKNRINGTQANKQTVVSHISNKTALSEFETRKVYIDLYLNEAGWEVVDPNNNTTLPNGTTIKCGSVIPGKACSEIKVTGLPHGTGIGFCDYVLYGKDGKPLAIVEAKKTSVDAIVGQQQVRQYGKCMEEQYGYVPVLYYTNGYDIYVIDGKYPERKIVAFHTLDELSYIIQKRNIKKITDITIKDEIAGRPYQKMAITSICERFNNMQRRALTVMATGTGKTRTAIALVELLTRNNWIKNVLFLADRTSLVKQAFKNFDKLMPNMTYAVLNDPSQANEPNARITFSTHQTMINYIDSEKKDLGIGRFDLIIIDEAHRSIFNKYGAIFTYFDSLLVGLTATPKDEVDANTYSLFNCESGVPNFSYSLEEAVKDHYLVPYKLINRKAKSLSEGVPYVDLSEEDKSQLELLSDEVFNDETIIASNKLFKKIYNKDTCRRVIEDLMNLGLRVNQGQQIGKTIIFAVNHYHACLVVDTFNSMYPQYPGYCKLIDNRVKNSEDLIDEFETDPNFRIAVSVDMLDTGIDVPSVLNLVFFKKINSNIKLVQMIGRGTRLCEGLIDGSDKKHFYIFDYFNNFKNVNEDFVKQPQTIAQKLFGIRLDMLYSLQSVEHQMNLDDRDYYNDLKKLLFNAVKYIKANGSERICVREAMNYIDKYSDESKWQYISELNTKEIHHNIKPLIESDIKEEYLTLSFDFRMLQIEQILITTGKLDTAVAFIQKIRLIVQTLLNKATIAEISAKIDDLQELYGGDIWTTNSLGQLEYYRKSVRHLMKYLIEEKISGVIIDHYDEIEDGELIENPFADIRTYKEKVLDYLLENSNDSTLEKIKNLEPLDEKDFEHLEELLWIKLGTKDEYYSISSIDNLAVFIRSIVGIEQEAINEAFSKYLNENDLSFDQQEFIYSIISYVRENGDVDPQVLIEESPFDHYNILELFGNDIPIVVDIVNRLHSCIAMA